MKYALHCNALIVQNNNKIYHRLTSGDPTPTIVDLRDEGRLIDMEGIENVRMDLGRDWAFIVLARNVNVYCMQKTVVFFIENQTY